MTGKIFDLEQRIMKCWNVVDDLDDLYYYFGDDPFFKDMDAKHRDKICNLLLGMKEMYQIKFQKCIFDFEDVCKEYHSRNKRHDHETGEDWPDEDRMDIIGQNGNNGLHYEDPAVNPNHYTKGNIECIDYITEALGTDGTVAFCQGNVTKYLHRWKQKNGIQDLKKAQWYLNKMIAIKESNSQN
jgi:hypothetical protein